MPVVPGLEARIHQCRTPARLGRTRAAQRRQGRQPILFGGDLGRYSRPMLPDPSPGVAADVLLVESTYGDRAASRRRRWRDAGARRQRDAARGGKLIIPAFAIGRVEEVLYWLFKLEERAAMPMLPVYVDSPMALTGAASSTSARRDELDPEMRRRCGKCRRVLHGAVRPSASPESKALVDATRPAIVIASSGMATGGRVVHHLFAALPDPRNTVLFVGLPGGRHARPSAGRRRPVREDVRPAGAGPRAIEDRRHVGARRCRRDHPLAADVPAGRRR